MTLNELEDFSFELTKVSLSSIFYALSVRFICRITMSEKKYNYKKRQAHTRAYESVFSMDFMIIAFYKINWRYATTIHLVDLVSSFFFIVHSILFAVLYTSSMMKKKIQAQFMLTNLQWNIHEHVILNGRLFMCTKENGITMNTIQIERSYIDWMAL